MDTEHTHSAPIPMTASERCQCGAETTSGSIACEECWNKLGEYKVWLRDTVVSLKRERDAIYQLLVERTNGDPANILTAIRKVMDE